MRGIVYEGRTNEEKGCISFFCRCGYRFLWRLAGIGSLPEVAEGNAEIMGGNKKEEGLLAYHGEFKGGVQW